MSISRISIQVQVRFYSYFKDLTGCSEVVEMLPEGSTMSHLQEQLGKRFPKLEPMKKSTLAAIGLEYQGPDYILRAGDEVALFPPVQGG